LTQSLFIADLHLDPANPETVKLAIGFLANARAADQLYILGDLFEYWLGDDAGDPA
jgi:UDP-2,3-diacylglucosamine hydrolase